MESNVATIVVMFASLCGLILLIYPGLVRQEKEFYNSLPSLEEAREQIAKEFPEFFDSFMLTQKVTETVHGEWGAIVRFYGDFLVCEELGVSIRVRLGDKMS